MSRRRAGRLVVLSLLLGLVALSGASPARACACGGFVAADGERVAADAEYAVLSHDGATERVLLSMNALADTPDAALLLPTPAPAEAALAEPGLFAELDRLTAPEVEVEYRWWPRRNRGDTAGAPGGVGGAPPVSVLKTKQLGDLEVTTLSATDAEALTAWLDSHGYALRDGLAEALQPYVTDGWYYTAIRLTTESDDLSGALQPLDLTFRATDLVYPMRLSAAATRSQFVRTFVFADHQVRRSDATARQGRSDLRFAGPVAAGAVTSDALREIATEHPYLTVHDQYFSNPGTEIVSDFTFEQAPSDTPYRRTTHVVRTRTVLGLPAGPVLLVAGVVAVNLAVLAVFLGRRPRTSRR